MQDMAPHRAAYINAVNTIEGRDPQTGQRILNKDGMPVSRYVVNRDETNMFGGKSVQFKKIKVTRSYLRSEIQLQSNLTNYNFPILTNVVAPGSNGVNPTEQRLKQQDVFFCHRLGFYIYYAGIGGNFTNYRYELMTFPDPVLYGSLGIDLDLMQALWTTGQLQVTVNNDVLTPAWDLLQHMRISDMQINTVNWPAIAPFGSPYFNSQDYTKDGLVVVEPNWVLNGGNDNEYVVSYPQNIATIGNIGPNGNIMWLVLKFEGFLAQNCSSIMDNKSQN